MIEFDKELELETIARIQARPFFAVALAFADFNGFFDADELLGGVLLLQPGLLQQEHERRCRAVHDGNFFGSHIDIQIINAKPRAGRHQMLDGRYPHPVLDQHRSHARIADFGGFRGEVDGRVDIDTTENDPCVYGGRTQGQLDLGAGMDANACRFDNFLDGALFQHDDIINLTDNYSVTMCSRCGVKNTTSLI